MTLPKLLVVGEDARHVSLITLDLADPAEALAVARRLAQETGRVVTVRDAHGEVLHTVNSPTKN